MTNGPAGKNGQWPTGSLVTMGSMGLVIPATRSADWSCKVPNPTLSGNSLAFGSVIGGSGRLPVGSGVLRTR